MCRCTVRALTEKQVSRRGLKVLDSSKMSVDEISQQVGVDRKTGAVIERPGKRIFLPDPAAPGSKIAFIPDPGWSYNPGRSRVIPPKTPPATTSILSRPQPGAYKEYAAEGGLIRKELEQRPSVAAAVGDDEKWAIAFQGELLELLKAERGAGSVNIVAQGGQNQALDLLEEAASHYPASWIQAANQFGPLNVKLTATGRGWAYTTKTPGNIELKPPFGAVTAQRNEGFIVTGTHVGTAIHELGHRLQSAMPDLDRRFVVLHRERTAGDQLESLQDLQPNLPYEAHEVTRKDKYTDPYFGRTYEPDDPLEVLAMAFQSTLRDVGGDRRWVNKLRNDDPEMLDLTIGLLMRFEP